MSTARFAIVGMACRFPGADQLSQFWENLINGTCSIEQFDDQTALADGADPTAVNHGDYVFRWGALAEVDTFDAQFFGIPAAEAELLDPQHRIFLEVAHEALEDGACVPTRYEGMIGAFAGVGPNTYLMHHLLPNRERLAGVDDVELMIGNDKDFVTTRLSYKLDLIGPSMAVNAGCSSALLAVHQACRALSSYQADAVVAGAVNLSLPQRRGYLARRGGILSMQGQVRPFDATADGTIFGNGCGVVLLKRAEDAQADGNTPYALIRARRRGTTTVQARRGTRRPR